MSKNLCRQKFTRALYSAKQRSTGKGEPWASFSVAPSSGISFFPLRSFPLFCEERTRLIVHVVLILDKSVNSLKYTHTFHCLSIFDFLILFTRIYFGMWVTDRVSTNATCNILLIYEFSGRLGSIHAGKQKKLNDSSYKYCHSTKVQRIQMSTRCCRGDYSVNALTLMGGSNAKKKF